MRNTECGPVFASWFRIPHCCRGWVAEWLKAHAWKACGRATVSRVRISPHPWPREESDSRGAFRGPGETERERTPLATRALHSEVAVHDTRELATDGEAQARASTAGLRRFHLNEWLEYRFELPGGNSHTCVLHVQRHHV